MEPSLQETTVVQYNGERSDIRQFHGHGEAVFSSGQAYVGEWQHGHMDGFGRLCFTDGVSYEGSISSDRISGRGVYQWGNTIYEGEVLDGLRHGHGTITFTDSPVVYEGEWLHRKRHGRGVLYYNASRTAYYEGDWDNDMKHGHGTSVYPSGNSYSGSWAYDKREGPGTMAWTSKGQTYSGMWADNLPNGLGEHVWQQGMPSLQIRNHAMHLMFNRYFGMFKDGKRHGEGALWYSNGARYEGQWENDRKQGSGVYIFEDGTVFAGQFAADRPVLQSGTMFSAACTFAAEAVEAATAVTVLPAESSAISAAKAAAAAEKPLTSRSASGASSNAKAEQSTINGAAKAAAAASISIAPGAEATAARSSTGVMIDDGPPGFGPRISSPQLYIADLLQECNNPAATYKAVVNLLTGCNTELRALYDKYCNRLSPLLDPNAPRHSWALQAGQLWELLKDSQLLCRHLQLQHACELMQQTLQPSLPVAERRQKVLNTTDAAAVLSQQMQLYDPATELLYRDFCELLVRLSALRYPQLPCLEQQLQQVLTQHLLSLIGCTNRQGGCRQSMAQRASVVPGPVAVQGTCEQPIQQDNVICYLQSQAELLQHLFGAFAAWHGREDAAPRHLGPGQPDVADQMGLHQQQMLDGDAEQHIYTVQTAWTDQTVTVRQVVAVLQQAGVLQRWQVDAYAVAAMLLEGALNVTDPEGLRARLDDSTLEPDSADMQPALDEATSQAAAQAAARQELLFWIDAPLVLVELLWGLVRCATILQPEQLNVQAQQVPPQPNQQGTEQQAGSAAFTVRGQPPTGPSAAEAATATGTATDSLTKLQALLEGHAGLYERILGLKVAEQEQEGEEQQQSQHTSGQEPDESGTAAIAGDCESLKPTTSDELRPGTAATGMMAGSTCTAAQQEGDHVELPASGSGAASTRPNSQL